MQILDNFQSNYYLLGLSYVEFMQISETTELLTHFILCETSLLWKERMWNLEILNSRVRSGNFHLEEGCCPIRSYMF